MTERLAGFDLADPEVSLLVLLLGGHVFADFLFQTRSMVERKGEARVLVAHAAVVVGTQFLFVLPWIRWHPADLVRAGSLLLLLGVLHGLIDWGKGWMKRRLEGESLSLFAVDQAAHAVTLLGIWGLWSSWILPGAVARAPLSPGALQLLTAAVLVLSVYVLNGNGAAAVIELFLARFPVGERAGAAAEHTDVQRMGWTIGILERMLVLSLVLLGQWQAIGWIFAGKTVARFRELNDRAFSEYYLIGTLSSLLFCGGTGALARLILTGAF